MRKVDVLRDGGCLFRAIAVSLFKEEYGIGLGKGAEFGKEKTMLQLVHNVLSRWVRALALRSLHGAEVDASTVLPSGMSLCSAMQYGYGLIQGFGAKYRFQSPREARWNKRVFLPAPSQKQTCNENFVYEPGGVSVNIISLSGRRHKETHKAYCRRMMSPFAWGGAGEIYVLSRVLKRAIIVHDADARKTILRTYVPPKVGGVLHIAFSSEEEHYQAMV